MDDNQKKVLLIDDDVDQLFLLEAMLEREMYEVTTAPNAREGLELLSMSTFDVVITDIAMPQMNGLEFASNLRQIPGKEGIPIVLLTAGMDPVDFSSHNFRANAFCLKRNLKESLLPTLKKILSEENCVEQETV